MSCVRPFEQFDWLAPSDAAEKLRSIQLSSTRVAERLNATIVRNKQSKYNSRSAVRGKIRLVEYRLIVRCMNVDSVGWKGKIPLMIQIDVFFSEILLNLYCYASTVFLCKGGQDKK